MSQPSSRRIATPCSSDSTPSATVASPNDFASVIVVWTSRGSMPFIRREVADEAAIDLQRVNRQPGKDLQGRMTGAEVVDRDRDARVAETARESRWRGAGLPSKYAFGDLKFESQECPFPTASAARRTSSAKTVALQLQRGNVHRHAKIAGAAHRAARRRFRRAPCREPTCRLRRSGRSTRAAARKRPGRCMAYPASAATPSRPRRDPSES